MERLRKKYFYHFSPRLRVSLNGVVQYLTIRRRPRARRVPPLAFGQFDNEFVSRNYVTRSCRMWRVIKRAFYTLSRERGTCGIKLFVKCPIIICRRT